MKNGKATPFWKGGVFCIRLNVEPSAREAQQIAVGIDPGSKKEGYSVASAAHTYLNIQADAVVWVSDAVAKRRQFRRSRRGRKAPCRKPRSNKLRAEAKIAPSTKARWQWKLRLANALCELFPVRCLLSRHQGLHQRQAAVGSVVLPVASWQGLVLWGTWETRSRPNRVSMGNQGVARAEGTQETGRKTAEVWNAHCVDAWVLAAAAIGGEITPTTLACCV